MRKTQLLRNLALSFPHRVRGKLEFNQLDIRFAQADKFFSATDRCDFDMFVS